MVFKCALMVSDMFLFLMKNDCLHYYCLNVSVVNAMCKSVWAVAVGARCVFRSVSTFVRPRLSHSLQSRRLQELWEGGDKRPGNYRPQTMQRSVYVKLSQMEGSAGHSTAKISLLLGFFFCLAIQGMAVYNTTIVSQ